MEMSGVNNLAQGYCLQDRSEAVVCNPVFA